MSLVIDVFDNVADRVEDRVYDWWERVDEPAWLARLEDEVNRQGFGTSYSRCFLAHNHLRRGVARWMVAAAVGCALSPYGLIALFAGLLAAALLDGCRLPHETLRVPPSRMLDGWLAAGFLIVPLGLLAIGGTRAANTLAGRVELLAIPLAVGGAALLLIDSWCFTRSMWFTCDDGLVASTGRGQIRTSFGFADVAVHRIESAVRLASPWTGEDASRTTDEWWLTLTDGRTEHLFLHQGSALEPGSDTDALTVTLARQTKAARSTDDARAMLRRGAPVRFGRITATLEGIEVDGIKLPWAALSRKRAAVRWGRRRWNGRWTKAWPHWVRPARSTLFVGLPDGSQLGVPTRQIDNLFALKALWLTPPHETT
jgi:hypothetical protein